MKKGIPDSVDEFPTLASLLRWRAQHQSHRVAYAFLRDGITHDSQLTYADLDLQARAIGGALQDCVASGERALLIYPPGLDFVCAFFGCLYAGVIAVPAPPPDPFRLKQTLPRLQGIAKDAQVSLVMTTAQGISGIEGVRSELSQVNAAQWLMTEATGMEWAEKWEDRPIAHEALAYLQYTSGSTSTPKGVMISHRNLMQNCSSIRQLCSYDKHSLSLTWMPYYHDYGLVQGLLLPLYVGIPAYVMSSLAFLKRPIHWLEAISRYRVTESGGPNFAYDYCVRKTTPEQRTSLDLSSWRVASCGAEPIRKDTMSSFLEAFEPCGFERQAFYPAYGIAESTLLVSLRRQSDLPVSRDLDAGALEQGRIVDTAKRTKGVRTMMGCGHPIGDTTVAIVHPISFTRCGANEVGEIWLSSPSVSQGYWNRPEETKDTFGAYVADTGEGPFFRTGDLGFMKDGELFVTGRLKDLIIIRGRNHYPQDIERTVEQSHSALRPGRGAAFSIEAGNEEQLVLIQEVERRIKTPNIDEIAGTIRQAVADQHELHVYAVILVRAGSVPKTSSGKIQRRACRDAFLSNRLAVIGSSILDSADLEGSHESVTRDTILALPAAERNTLLESCLQESVSKALRIAPSRFTQRQPLNTLGLDSLRAAELMYELETRFGVCLRLSTLLQGLTIKELATQVLAQLMAPPTLPIIQARAASNTVAGHPLSHNQSALWFLHQLAPESPASNTAIAVPLPTTIRGLALRQALEALADRHAMLRTTYGVSDGVPIQEVHAYPSVHLEEADASLWSWDELKTRIVRASEAPFDLTRGPLWRGHLFTRSTKEAILLLAAHHIAVDGWSMRVLVQDLCLFCEAQQGHVLSSLPPPDAEYTDYVRWQSAMLAGPEGERLWEYWRQQLAGELPVLDFPHDRPRPPVQTAKGASHAFTVGMELTRKLRALAKAEGTTLYTILLATFEVLLYRYTGQEDLLIASPMLGRSRAAFARTVGDFVNLVVLRGNLSDNPTFKSLLGNVRHTVLAAIEHQDYPFPLLVERLQRTRDPSHSPLAQVMFVLQQFKPFQELDDAVVTGKHGTTADAMELQLEPFAIPQETGQFDLTVEIFDGPEQLYGNFEYSTDLYEVTTIRRMIGHFRAVLEGIVAEPKERISELPLTTADERHQLLVAWNDTKTESPGNRCIHELFEVQVKRTPEAVAVMYEDQQLTYLELNRRANQLGHYLQRIGVGPEVLVGICVERSLEMIVGLFGILKAGGAYLPLDPAYPRERLAFMLEDARAPVVLTQHKLRAELPTHGARVVCLDSEWEVIATESEKRPTSGVTTENLTYVIYTSGSTGKPKGVMIEHGSLVNYTEAVSDEIGLAPGDRMLQFASISFDTAAEEIFPCLLRGATLVLRTDSMLDSVPKFLRKCHEWRLTVLDLPTVYWHELTLRLSAESLVLPPSIRVVLIGGERALRQPLVTWLERVGRGVRLVNTYGPTEATVASTMCDLSHEPATALDLREVPIGHAIRNTQVYVLDEHLQPVPIGAHGQLYVGGAGLARGYLERPDLTAAQFIPNPFSKGPGSRLYKTGDMARWRSDGNLEYLGRIDYQAKLRGFRIELGEIEAVLGTHPAIREAVVVFREDLPGDKRLVAFLVAEPRTNLTSSDVRDFVKTRLPEYMVPSAFVELDALPLTANGKVDRRALLAPSDSRERLPNLKTVYVAPRDPIEQALAEMWGEILELKEVGIHDNFFELGGHSLFATQVVSRLREIFQIEIPLRVLFEAPTVARLAQRIALTRREGQPDSSVPPLKPVSREGELPLSFAQERLWFLHQLAPQSSAYNIPAAVRLAGPLDKAALTFSLDQLVKRHESLRTTFTEIAGRLTQVIHPSFTLKVSEIDLRSLPQDRRMGEAVRAVTDEARHPFDLIKGPLIRAVVVQLGDEDHVLAVNMHHIISDQWSFGVISRELVQCYNDFCEGHVTSSQALSIQYADFSHWQRQWLRGEVLESQLSYWKKQLVGIPVLALPSDRPRPALQTFRGTYLSLDLPRSLVEGLKRLSLNEGVTLYMTFLAAFLTLLHRYTGQEDIAIGSPIANRHRLAIEGLIGSFVNTLVLRTDLSGAPAFRELLARVRDVALGAYAHQDLPFEKLVAELHPDRDIGGIPLVQVLFNFANAPLGRVDFKHLSWTPFEIDRGAAQFDLSLTIDPVISRKVHLEFNTDLFESTTAVRILRHYRTLLESIVAGPEVRISELQLLAEGERRQMLVEWNNTQADYPETCVAQLIEAQAARMPQAVAVVFNGETLSYGQLNARANQLARHLQQLGVGPEVLVAVCMERSLDMLVSLIGIMKAGGAYVPLDPGFPNQRQSFMLANSQASVLLTQRHLAEGLPDHRAHLVLVDTEWEAIRRQSPENLLPMAKPGNLAYVIYTSGSTGQPKGVEIEHRALVNCLESMRREPGLTERDVLLSVTTLSFDIAGLELYLPLLAGARVVLVSREEAVDGVRLMRLLRSTGATTMQATPATWRLLLQAGWEGSPGLKILCGGEALSRDLAEALLKRGASVWNMYGPTETTIWSTVNKVESEEGPVSIGRPIANTQVYILDSMLQPVPVGISGELCIGGDGLARGYLASPQLTAEKFVVSPFIRGGQRIYKTGDLARWLSDGCIECLGRTDHQIKIRGFRVELGEIESVLVKDSTVQQCVVVPREDTPGEKRLVAYIVPQHGQRPNVAELRQRLREQLSDYMVPTAFVILEALPLTPNGKVNRLALPPPHEVRPEVSTPQVAPRNRLEIQLVAIWEQVLGVSGIGVRENFFELGGHSLLALRIFGEIERSLGRRLPMVTLFQAPTIEQLADILTQEAWSASWNSLIAIQTGGGLPPFFAVPGLGGNVLGFLEFAKLLGPDQPFYGLQSRGLDGIEKPFTRIEDMAAHYINEIRQVQPEGPYYLGGTCIGGVVAYEMAQQLQEQGHKVSLLTLMETWPPSSLRVPRFAVPFWMRPSLFLLFGIARHGRVLLQLRPGQWSSYMRQGMLIIRDMVAYGDMYRGDRAVLYRDRVSDANRQAAARYRPKPYSGRLSLILASSRPVAPSQDTRLAWGTLAADGYSTDQIPAEDSGRLFVKPHVQVLAGLLKTLLAQARAKQ